MSTNIDWSDVIKKEARGMGDADFGEVQNVSDEYVLVQRGLINLERFSIPKDLVESYDGSVLRFRVYEEEALEKYRTYSDSTGELQDNEKKFNDTYGKAQQNMGESLNENNFDSQTISLIEENMNVSKKVVESNATITKKPVTETKTIEVPVIHETISIERRRPSYAATMITTNATSNNQTVSYREPVKSKKEIKIPIKREEVEVSRTPYVREEVVVKKRPVTEAKKITETVTSENADVVTNSE